ncbi:hypothetical protein E3E12_02835 [Formicincola oecophyllae]|uniref:Uncharacterized protein n=1 Tax=Formicincola oecophyllae TaxID=2558361 RepID=A0A4Y6U7L1_9PROT|nr:hypothetical protein [Formicincola oecophyllae]QDH13312.1 hypothetical protein E3E12_02835 [Formicincola oecophyllae]
MAPAGANPSAPFQRSFYTQLPGPASVQLAALVAQPASLPDIQTAQPAPDWRVSACRFRRLGCPPQQGCG